MRRQRVEEPRGLIASGPQDSAGDHFLVQIQEHVERALLLSFFRQQLAAAALLLLPLRLRSASRQRGVAFSCGRDDGRSVIVECKERQLCRTCSYLPRRHLHRARPAWFLQDAAEA